MRCYNPVVVEYRILGPLEVIRDGDPVDLGGRRQRAVLTLLLLDANRLVSTDLLRDRLWGERPPPTATTSLHNALSHLRKALGDGVIETRPPGYVLHVDPESFDLARFEARVKEARAAEGDRQRALLESALAEWRGPPLLEASYEPWAEPEIRRLAELRVEVVEQRIDADLALGRHAEVVAELEALVAEHPLRERLRGQLMLALYRSGRQADASLAYQDARRTLVEEFGVEPGPELRRLHGAIVRQDVDAVTSSAGGRVLAVEDVAAAILAGRVVPVLGEDTDGLGARLADRFRYPSGQPADVARISQFAAAVRGYGPLHDAVREWVLSAEEPNRIHRFFASLPPRLRELGVPHQLLVTTSYGRALERAFAEAGEAIDVVSYISSGPDRGRFRHAAPDGSARVVELPNLYAQELALERRPVVLRLRGCLGDDGEPSSLVVTEDDHIDFLRRADVAATVPVALAATLRRSHFLFLGYTVRDWTLRLVLGRIWGDEPPAYRSWAVHPRPGPAERELWRRLDVDLEEAPLEQYVDALAPLVEEAVLV
jgi:DNA-binding SARP family transcriptional activator